MKKPSSNIASQLKEVRIKHNLTQSEMAVLLDVTSVTISRWEGGISEPRNVARRRISMLANDLEKGIFKIQERTRKDIYQPRDGDLEDSIHVVSVEDGGGSTSERLTQIDIGDLNIIDAIEFLSKLKIDQNSSEYIKSQIKIKCSRSYAKRIYSLIKRSNLHTFK